VTGGREDQGGGRQHVTTWPVGLGITAAIVGAVAFAVSFWVDASNAWIGGSLALALLGLGLALAFWGRDLADDEVISGRYPVPPDDTGGQAALATQLDEHASVLTRRGFLFKFLLFGLGVFALSQVVLLGALGPWPGRSLFTTGWRKGRRLVTSDGEPVTRDALANGGFLVAFPEGGEDHAGSQIVLLHFVADEYTPPAGRETWAPENFVAYSRICTHAGCPVAQYADVDQVLLCPCHQSSFDVLNGAQVVGGPASRPLPQLPLAIDKDGVLYAQSDFTESVGPGFWDAT
jgi:ubiquinol-cytochrome c reductase iron-sulfur subunit